MLEITFDKKTKIFKIYTKFKNIEIGINMHGTMDTDYNFKNHPLYTKRRSKIKEFA